MIDKPSAGASLSRCPFCREIVVSDAIKCRHCHSVLAPLAENVQPRIISSPTVEVAVSPPLARPDHGMAPEVLFLSISIFALLIIISCPQDADAKDTTAGALLLFGAPAVVGSVYVLSKKTSGAVFSYFALTILGLSLLRTLGVYARTRRNRRSSAAVFSRPRPALSLSALRAAVAPAL